MIGKILEYLKIAILAIIITTILINLIVILSTQNNIIAAAESHSLSDVDCILILGAGIRAGSPSPMLEDRLLLGTFLYENKASPKILVSGDHMNEDYDEVNVMKNYLIENNIPSQDIFMDHAGISTYDSIYRAKYIFGAKNIIIVTQRYHLPRALYIADKLDLNAYGVASNPRKYAGQSIREIREILARIKDFFKVVLKLPATYLGEPISFNQSGDITND